MTFSFGDFELDEERFELRRLDGGAVELQPKVLELLLHLVRNRARIVSKQEILEALWPDAIVTDGSLARAVSLARAAIDDRGHPPHAIVTVARRGYRFEAPVREVPARQGSRRRLAAAGEATSRYIGRVALLARLEARLDDALAGDGCILFLAGEAGIGKTRTAELLAERARRAGATVAAAYASEDCAAGQWSWTPLLRTLAAREPSALARIAPAQRAALTQIVPELGSAQEAAGARWRGDDAERSALFEAVDALLAAALLAGPLALFLDDLHGADAESIALLEFVGQSLAARSLTIVVTCREEAAGSTPRQARAIERLLRSTALERWPLAGLNAQELCEFVRARLGGEADPALVAVLERQTGGNPLWIGESLRSLEARGLLGAARPAHEWEALLPRGIRHLLLPKLRRLSAEAAEALAFAAALGVEIDLPLLARSLPDAARLDERLGEAVAASLLLPGTAPGHGPRFAHALVREALYDELLPAGERRLAVHARISAALEQAASLPDDALATRAHHACEGVPRVRAERAIELARQAGAQAARRLDFERAVHWYERALVTFPFLERGDPALCATLQLGLGDARTRAYGLDRARTSYREAADHARSIGRGDQLARAALGFAHRPSSTGSADPESIRLLEEAHHDVPAGEETLRIRVLSRLAVELRYDEPARAEALMDEAIASARGLADPAALAGTLDDSSFVRWGPADSEGWIALNREITEAARAADDLELVLSGQRGLVTGWLELGDRAGVERELRACARTAAALRTPHARWFCAALQAMAALLDGDLGAAEKRVGEAVALGDRLDSREVALELGTPLVYLRFEQGRAAEIEAAVRAQVERFPDAAAWRAALARMLLAAGRRAEARVELERLARARFTDVPRDRGYLPTLVMCAEVARAVGDERAAEALEPRLTPHARLHVSAGSGLLYYGTVAYALGLVAEACSRPDDAVGHFERALAAEESMGAKLWAARTRLATARALLARGAPGDRPQAARLARAALRAARQRAWHDVAEAGGDLETVLWRTRASAPPAAARGAAKGTES